MHQIQTVQYYQHVSASNNVKEYLKTYYCYMNWCASSRDSKLVKWVPSVLRWQQMQASSGSFVEHIIRQPIEHQHQRLVSTPKAVTSTIVLVSSRSYPGEFY